MTQWPNKPDAVNLAIASRFAVGHHWPEVTDPERWPGTPPRGHSPSDSKNGPPRGRHSDGKKRRNIFENFY